MRAILISDHAKWCALMMNGDKTIEVRTSKALAKATQKLIDEYGYAEIYVYCCKDNKKHLYPVALLDKHNKVFKRGYKEDDIDNRTNYLNGKVAFKFRCYKVEEISWQIGVYDLEQQWFIDFLNKCCLGFCELKNYLNKKNGYAIHISNLEIFDKPKELSEFKHWVFYKKCSKCPYGKCDNDYGLCSQCCEIKPLTKAPQSWCYIEV